MHAPIFSRILDDNNLTQIDVNAFAGGSPIGHLWVGVQALPGITGLTHIVSPSFSSAPLNLWPFCPLSTMYRNVLQCTTSTLVSCTCEPGFALLRTDEAIFCLATYPPKDSNSKRFDVLLASTITGSLVFIAGLAFGLATWRKRRSSRRTYTDMAKL